MLKSDAGGLTVYLDGLYEYALPAASETVMGEVGYINDVLTHADMTIVLGRSYNNPVVFAQPVSQDENDVAVVRISDIQADRFTLHVDEAPNHDGAHTTEAVSYIVLEAGSWELADGALLEVGTVNTAATVGSALSDQWESVLFSQEFAAAPVVLSQVQTDNDPHWVKSRQQLATTTGVNLALEEEEGKSTPHGAETVGWLAIEPGTGEWSGRLYEAALTADAVTHSWYSFSFSQSFSAAPRFLAGLAGYDSDESAHLRYKRIQLTAAGAQVRAEEDSLFDSEYAHTTETAAYTAEGMPFCTRHGVPMARRSKQGDKWFSHKVTDPDTGRILYCRGYAAPSSPGFEISPIVAPMVARAETRSAAPVCSGSGRQDNLRPGGSVDLEKLNQELFG